MALATVMVATSSAAHASDPHVWLALTATAVLVVALSHRRILRSVSTLLQKLRLSVVVTRRPGSIVGTVTSLHIHPVKSLRAVSVQLAKLSPRGFEGDRTFMLVTPAPTPLVGFFSQGQATHRFLTQRTCPTLATVNATFDSGRPKSTTQFLTLSSKRLPGKVVTLSTQPLSSAPIYLAALWGDVVQVQDMGEEASTFFTELVASDPDVPDGLKSSVRLVVQTPKDGRSTDPKFTPASARSVLSDARPKVSLTDGFPLLVGCQSSLAELNGRLQEKNKPELPMARFRPNIVISNRTPFEEDRWKVIRIGDCILHVVKPCPRCKQSCTDQRTGVVTDEPLSTLADFRALDSKNLANVYFCQNALASPASIGKSVRVGDTVEVLEWGTHVYTD